MTVSFEGGADGATGALVRLVGKGLDPVAGQRIGSWSTAVLPGALGNLNQVLPARPELQHQVGMAQ